VKNNDLLESAFKNAFDRFEEPVSPKVWESVSAKINTPAPSPGNGSGAGASSGGAFSGSLGVWVAGGLLVAASVAGYFMLKSEPDKTATTSATTEVTAASQVTEPEAVTTPQPVQESISNKSATELPAKTIPAISESSKHSDAIEPAQSKNVGSDKSANPVRTSENTTFENDNELNRAQLLATYGF